MGKTIASNHAKDMESGGVRPLEPYPGSNARWKCECLRCGSTVFPRYYTVVVAKKGGCNFCAKKDAAQISKKAAETRALEMAGKLKLKPLEPYPRAHEFWKLQCLVCGTVVKKKAYSVTAGKGCLTCNVGNGGRQKKERASQPALHAMLEADLRPLVPYPGRHQPWTSQCLKCGQIVSPRANGILSGQGGCITCGLAKRAKTRSIPEEAAIQLMLASSAKPLVPYPGSRSPWKSTCMKCGLSISPTLHNLKRHGACKRCSMIQADSAFDYFGDAVFYMIENRKLGAMKIGIAGLETRRLQDHRQNGWAVVKTTETRYGYRAWYAEAKVLAWLRSEKNLAACVDAMNMPQGGYTETFPIGQIDDDEVWAKVLEEIGSSDMPIPQALLDGTASRKARRTCTLVIDGKPCLNKYLANGYCRKHELAWKTYGDPLFTKKVFYPNSECQVIENGESCGKAIDRKGMCSVHYYRSYVYGDPLYLKRPTPNPLPKSCEIDGCIEAPYAKRMCQRHYSKQWKANSRHKGSENN